MLAVWWYQMHLWSCSFLIYGIYDIENCIISEGQFFTWLSILLANADLICFYYSIFSSHMYFSFHFHFHDHCLKKWARVWFSCIFLKYQFKQCKMCYTATYNIFFPQISNLLHKINNQHHSNPPLSHKKYLFFDAAIQFICLG